MRFIFLLSLLALTVACDPTEPLRPPDGSVTQDANVDQTDTDGDGIPDSVEGTADTDGDGTPDAEDTDSDGDGIDDSAEAGSNPSNPLDSDNDGTPDFQDLDSDGNGINDADEPTGDFNSDGTPDFQDDDDDGDRLSDSDEMGDDPTMPVDTDMDGMPDYVDTDSDNDTIADRDEFISDADGDGVFDRHQLDSDNDGFSDAMEAGDMDENTAPVDTDADGIPDYRDPDSDADGLSDAQELARGTDRTLADTDGDGVTDLVEVAACPTGDMSCADDATNMASSPRSRGDFVFIVPFMEAPTPSRDTLDFSTNLQRADVYFLIDTTGSMQGAIDNVESSLLGATGIIEQVRATIADTWFGLGSFKDYPVGASGTSVFYGSASDFAYQNNQDITMDSAAIQSAVATLSASGGGDEPESHLAALTAMATGMGLAGTSIPGGSLADRTDCPMATFGYPCFRSGAVPIIVLISDAPMHGGPPSDSDPYDMTALGATAPTYAETVTALTAARARVISVAVRATASSDIRTQMSQLATDTGALDATGLPLVSSAADGAVSGSVINQIRALANQAPIDISLEFVDDASDSIETFAAFVDHVEANTTGSAARGCTPRMAVDTNDDTFPDTFRGVQPGSPVCFDIVVKQNDTIMPTSDPQLLRATLRVLGDGFTELDSRDVFFLVPPEVVILGPS